MCLLFIYLIDKVQTSSTTGTVVKHFTLFSFILLLYWNASFHFLDFYKAVQNNLKSVFISVYVSQTGLQLLMELLVWITPDLASIPVLHYTESYSYKLVIPLCLQIGPLEYIGKQGYIL